MRRALFYAACLCLLSVGAASCSSTSSQKIAMNLCREAFEVYWERDWDAVIELATKAMKMSEDLPWPYSQRGYAYMMKGQYDLAGDDLDMAIELDPEFGAAYFNRGVLFDELGRRAEAISDYSKAIQYEPFGDAYYRRAIDYIEIGQLSAAEFDLRKAIELEQDPYLMVVMAELQVTLENHEEACRMLIKAAEKGYQDTEYFESSEKLAPLRHLDCYIEALSMLPRAPKGR